MNKVASSVRKFPPLRSRKNVDEKQSSSPSENATKNPIHEDVVDEDQEVVEEEEKRDEESWVKKKREELLEMSFPEWIGLAESYGLTPKPDQETKSNQVDTIIEKMKDQKLQQQKKEEERKLQQQKKEEERQLQQQRNEEERQLQLLEASRKKKDFIVSKVNQMSASQKIDLLRSVSQTPEIKTMFATNDFSQIDELVRKIIEERLTKGVEYGTGSSFKLFDFKEIVDKGTKESVQKELAQKKNNNKVAVQRSYEDLESAVKMTQQEIDRFNAQIDTYQKLNAIWKRREKSKLKELADAKVIKEEKERYLQFLVKNMKSEKIADPSYVPSVDEKAKVETAQSEFSKAKKNLKRYQGIVDNLPKSKHDFEQRIKEMEIYSWLEMPFDDQIPRLQELLLEHEKRKEELTAQIKQNRSQYSELDDSDLSELLDIPERIEARVSFLTEKQGEVKTSIVKHIEQKWAAKKAEKEEQISGDYSKFQRDEENLSGKMRQKTVTQEADMEEFHQKCKIELDKIVHREEAEQTRMTEEYPSLLEGKKKEIMREIQTSIQGIEELNAALIIYESQFVDAATNVDLTDATAKVLNQGVVGYGPQSGLSDILRDLSDDRYGTTSSHMIESVASEFDRVVTQVLNGNDYIPLFSRSEGEDIKFFRDFQQNSGKEAASQNAKVLFRFFQDDEKSAEYSADIDHRIQQQIANDNKPPSPLTAARLANHKNVNYPVDAEELISKVDKEAVTEAARLKATKLLDDKLSGFRQSVEPSPKVYETMVEMGIQTPEWFVLSPPSHS